MYVGFEWHIVEKQNINFLNSQLYPFNIRVISQFLAEIRCTKGISVRNYKIFFSFKYFLLLYQSGETTQTLKK